MFKSSILCSLVLGTALLVGCDDKKDTTVTTPATPSATDKMKDDASKMADTAKEKAGEMKDKAVEMKDKATDTAKATADDTTAEATKLLEQVKTYISEKKLDDADAALKKLEGMSDKLPETIKSQLPALRTSLNAAKGALGGVKLPGQ